jgi:3-methylcrotonyl-CoA carboxylase alpha subunit
VHKRTLAFRSPEETLYHVHITSLGPSAFDTQVQHPDGEILGSFNNVDGSLASDTSLHATIGSEHSRTTIVSQVEHHGTQTSYEEKLHIFNKGQRFTLTIPSPRWLLSLGEEAKRAMKGGLRAPMPSVVVDVKVKVGDAVKKGQALIILESMKTETVLRADEDGTVQSVACAKGDMVEEGTELAMIESSESPKET